MGWLLGWVSERCALHCAFCGCAVARAFDKKETQRKEINTALKMNQRQHASTEQNKTIKQDEVTSHVSIIINKTRPEN